MAPEVSADNLVALKSLRPQVVPMRVIASIAAMQRQALSWKRAGKTVGFVPTMGCLHDGHISLVREARRRVGADGIVVLSIYVNPTQFGPREDFSRYPRPLKRDLQLCRQAGVDLAFTPTDTEMYLRDNPAAFSTFVSEEALSQTMEGASRPTHFRGVTTVVSKLFNLVLPDLAVFGAKDFQQAAIIRRMVRDLNFPVKIIVAPTVRESDGLAMSSRNQYLEGDLRRQATALSQAIQQACDTVRSASEPVSAARLRAALRRSIERQPDARVDYIEFFDAETLAPAKQVTHGTHMAMAVFVGKTRLIDNAAL